MNHCLDVPPSFAGSGYLPASRAALDLPAARDVVAKYPRFHVALDLYESSPTTPAALGALLGPFGQVREALDTGVEAMLADAKDPDQALKDAADESNRIIAEQPAARRLGDGWAAVRSRKAHFGLYVGMLSHHRRTASRRYWRLTGLPPNLLTGRKLESLSSW